jgi:ribosomal protein S18 acetylase RimI-like enzyme
MKIESFDHIDELSRGIVFNGLKSYNEKFAIRNQSDFTISAKDQDLIIGVAMGESKFDWLILQYFWIDEKYRGRGLGKTILNSVENLARNRKLYGIHLETFEFQARGFYEKSGFRVFGEVENHPNGYKRYYMKKVLHHIKSAQQGDAPEPASPAR